jgi:3-dehydroquinate synthase
MSSLLQSFQVPFSYPVHFTENLFAVDNPTLRDFFAATGDPAFRKKVLVFLDAGVAACHPHLPEALPTYFATVPSVALVPAVLTLPGGEGVKNDPAHVETVLDAIDTHGIDRHSFVLAVGGGAFLDAVGYAAAIAHRGVKLLRVPTTVLAQNDSGVGVKNGVNFRGKKNFLGTFAPPVAVFNDARFLTTLDDRDWRSGIAEALKVALIKDVAFFEWLESVAEPLARRDGAAMQRLIFRCAELHLQHIAGGDPFESGSARPLDFGHWAAHKLESLTDFELRHGEAVAIGIALDTVYSHRTGRISAHDLHRVLAVFQAVGFELYHPALAEADKENLRRGLDEFREHLGGQLTITLLDALGRGVEVHELHFERVKEAVDFLEKTHEPA